MSDVARLIEQNRAMSDEIDRLNALLGNKRAIVRDEHGIQGTTIGNARAEGDEAEDYGDSTLENRAEAHAVHHRKKHK